MSGLTIFLYIEINRNVAVRLAKQKENPSSWTDVGKKQFSRE